MNIFVVDEDPIKAAQMLCDRHVSKMILETAQMLSFVAARYNYPALYSAVGSHKNHPCTLWAGDTQENWLWLIQHGLALRDEKLYRDGRGHKSADVIEFYLANKWGPSFGSRTRFAQAMPIENQTADAVSAYRNYYLDKKQFFKDGKRPVWTKRNPPDWWIWK